LERLPDTHRTCVFRVVQEALTNCGRHAQARHVRVALHGGPAQLTLTIQDDGAGFDVAAGRAAGGLGLVGIDERVRALSGALEILSQPRKGTLLRAVLPLPPEAPS
jgi:signal transduction histidine kinase